MFWWRILDGNLRRFRSTSCRAFTPCSVGEWRNGTGEIYEQSARYKVRSKKVGPITLFDFEQMLSHLMSSPYERGLGHD
jgi:hypothetical protein